MFSLLETEPIFDQSSVVLTQSALERLDSTYRFGMSDDYCGQIVVQVIAS